MRNWWLGLRRLMNDARRRRQLARQRRPRRGSLPSTTAVRQLRVAELEAEVYRLRVGESAGVGASVYAGNEELLRFDCFGPSGHFHINIRQSQSVASGKVQRIAFLSDTVSEQAAEAVRGVRRNLRNAIESNWHPDVRALAVSEEAIEQLTCLVAIELNALISPGDSSDREGARSD